MIMKKTVYLDTTIPSYYYDDRKETAFLREKTRSWFKTEARVYRIVVSEATLVEAQGGDYTGKEKVVEFIGRWPALRYDPILDQIVATYIDNCLMPAEYGGDALHLAYASYYKIDFLMTWNCDHLANANKRQHIRVINTRMGLHIPELVTPLELVKEVGSQ